MTAILVMTTGTTDVQFIHGDKRHEIRGGLLHDALRDRPTDWTIGDSHLPKAGKGDPPATLAETGALKVATPKIDAVIDYCKAKGIAPSRALFIDTDRPGDPHHAGRVLEKRLKEQYPSAKACVVSVLSEGRVEGDAQGRGAVKSEVVERVSKAVLDIITKPPIAGPAAAKIVVSTTGGIPAINELVEELAQLHAVQAGIPADGRYSLDVPDSQAGGGGASDHAVLRTHGVAASVQARHRALALLRQGHLHGAWGAVRHLKGVDGETWVDVVKWLHLWASSQPLDDACDISLLKHERQAVRAALRVEFALMADDVPDAVHGTVAFFEAALWDHLNERLDRWQPEGKPLLHALKDGDPPQDLVSQRGDCKRQPFECREARDGRRWYRVHDDARSADRLVHRFLRQDALSRLAKAISGVRALRNDVAHATPTETLMRTARAMMNKADLWSEMPTRFLCQELVAATLKELGVEGPMDLATKLIKDADERLGL